MDSSPAISASSQYTLTSDLARLCLPAATRDANRKLAYVTSISLLFLVVGLVGLKMPQPYVRPLPEVVEVVPVIFIPPEQPPAKTQETPEEPPEDTPEVTLEAPVIATVVAADASAVRFAVPVQGPVILAPVRFAEPPPQTTKAPPQQSGQTSTRYVPSQEDWIGGRSKPEYPLVARKNKWEGKCTVLVVVDASGAVVSATIQDKSGYRVLDEASVAHALKYFRLRQPPGETRHLIVPYEYGF